MPAPATAIPENTVDKPPRSTRWIPVSLRLFVTILLLLGIAGVWRCVSGYRQLTVIREIKRLRGTIESEPVGPKWLRDLAGQKWSAMFDDVIGVDVAWTQATDSTLEQISGLTNLKTLQIVGTHVTDAGLAHLAVC